MPTSPAPGETIDLQIDVGTFTPAEAVDLLHAARLCLGRGGRAPSLDTVRRWADPKQGYRPHGDGGPRIVLPTVRINGQKLTMPAWVEAFEKCRVRCGSSDPAA